MDNKKRKPPPLLHTHHLIFQHNITVVGYDPHYEDGGTALLGQAEVLNHTGKHTESFVLSRGSCWTEQ
jgi:hypothetical protein